MDFTREPIIESIITPKEGHKLVVRSSKSSGQEEFFVDSVEIVTYGNQPFFRSRERPKAFLVPASDYEVLEMRETRIQLKNVAVEKSIKIGGGKAPKEEKAAPEYSEEESSEDAVPQTATSETTKIESREDRRREKRRQSRKRRTEEETAKEPNTIQEEASSATQSAPTSPAKEKGPTPLIPPPTTLISETIARYRDNALFKEAFYVKEETTTIPTSPEQATPQENDDFLEAMQMQDFSLEPSELGGFRLFEEEPPAFPSFEEEKTGNLSTDEEANNNVPQEKE